jgi:hypothetical protein
MLWGDAQDRDLLAYVQRLVALRRGHPALVAGKLQTLYLDEASGLWLGRRTHGGDCVLLAVNLGQATGTIQLPEGEFVDLDGRQATGNVTVEPVAVALLTSVHPPALPVAAQGEGIADGLG